MAKAKATGDVGFLFRPRSPGQQEADELWKRSRIQFLMGAAGTGKTCAALGMALREVLRSDSMSLLLSRPLVSCDEELGFEPGDLAAKLGSWMGPFRDCFTSLSVADWLSLERTLEKRLELIPVGRLRGRTVRNAVLIVDEAQNCSYAQLKSAVTRIGDRGRILFCGDPAQSDRFSEKQSPLMKVANLLEDLDTVSVVRFDATTDQLRDPLVAAILDRL